MENYIHQSQLDDLVSSIIGELFVKKSNNLVAFVINYLHRYHYDKVHDIIKEIKLPDKSYRFTYLYVLLYIHAIYCLQCSAMHNSFLWYLFLSHATTAAVILCISTYVSSIYIIINIIYI